MPTPKIDRRTLLKGFLGGAVVTLGLPPLECFFNSTGTAYASCGTLPKRFGLFFWGNGVLPDRWVPKGTGADYELSEQMAPLAGLERDITVVSGMKVQLVNIVPHGSGPGGILSGSPLVVRGEDWTFSQPSIDQYLAGKIGGETRFPSIEFGAEAEGGMSYNGPHSRNPAETSPSKLFDRIFGGGFQAPGEDAEPDPRIRLRRSVLDAVLEDAKSLELRLGTSDKRRLAQHMEGVRALEKRLASIEEDPPDLEACARPALPDSEFGHIDGHPQLAAKNAVMSDIMAMALACDQTRVFSNFITQPLNNLLFPGADQGFHQLTHDEPGEQPQVNAIVITVIAELARFLETLKAVPEGDGTLLDNCAVLCTSDVSYGRTHSLDEYPIIIAGSACGALKTGIHYRSQASENASKVLLSLVRAMDVPAAEYGNEGGRVTEGLGAIEA